MKGKDFYEMRMAWSTPNQMSHLACAEAVDLHQQ